MVDQSDPTDRSYATAVVNSVVTRPQPIGDDMLSEANRFVLDPSAEHLRALRDASVGDAILAGFVETIGFIVGLLPAPADPGTMDGEFADMAHAARATLALEEHQGAQAVGELEAAAHAAKPVSDALAGQLMGQLANIQLDEGGTQRAAVRFQAALDLMEGTDLHVSRAELHVAAGAMFQEMSEAAPHLMQAINHYDPDFVTAGELADQPSTASSLRFPYAIDITDDTMAAADTANNRVLVWDHTPDGPTSADRVLGLPDFTTAGENHWDSVVDDTLCWPDGLCLNGGRLAIADSDNNRITVWDL